MSNSKRPKGTWSQKLSFAAFSATLAILKVLPFRQRIKSAGWLIAGPLGRLVGYRKRVERNLHHIWPEMSDKERARIADQTLNNAGRTFVENLFPAEFQKANPSIELWGDGLEAVLEAQKNGQSIVFASGHFGNHEAFRFALYQQGIKVGGLYRPMSNPYVNEWYEGAIQVCGNSGPLYPVGKKGTLSFRQALKEGHALILLIDIAVAKGVELPFLGKPAMTSTAAAAFAIGAGSLYVPFFGMRNKDGHSFSVEIAAPIDHSDPETMTRAANDVLKSRIEADPGNWFWVHNRWKPWVR